MGKAAALVVVNRSASGFGGGLWVENVRTALESGLSPRFVFPSCVDEAREMVGAAVDAGVECVLAAGGDGTVNHVLNQLPGGVALGILPLGTANDLARGLGVPLEPLGAAQRLLAGRRRRIDLVEACGRRFCTAGGLGLSADTALSAGELRGLHPLLGQAVRWLGTAVYPLAAAGNILLRPHLGQRLRLVWHESAEGPQNILQIEAPGLLVANQGTLGAGLCVSGRSSNADGLFEICLLRRLTRLGLLGTLGKMRLGRPMPESEILVLRAERARIECSRPSRFFGDGELLCVQREIELRVLPQALEVLC